MKIEIYRFHKFKSDSNTKAFIDLIINNELVLKGFKLIEGREGLFLSTPREKGKDGKWFDRIRFQNVETKKKIEQEVIERYNEEDK